MTDLQSLLTSLTLGELKSLVEILMNRPMFRRADLALRWGVTKRAVDYAREDGRLPQPKDLNGPAWTAAQLAAVEFLGKPLRPAYQRQTKATSPGTQLRLEMTDGRNQTQKASGSH